jgi:ketosteroid isomerase-like protein
MAKADSIEARLQRVEDDLAIRRIIVDYATHLDGRDWTKYVELFAADGEWMNSGGSYKGHAAIRGMLENVVGKDGAANTANFHLVSNPRIDLDGDRAVAHSRFLFVIRGPEGGPAPALAGTYVDDFVREGAGWKIKRRVADNVMPTHEDWVKIRAARMAQK